MHYDIYPIDMAANIRINELRDQASNRSLVRQLSRRRRQALAKRLIAALRQGLDNIELILEENEPAVSPQAIR